MAFDEPGSQLQRSPSGMLLTGSDQAILHVQRHGTGTTRGSARALLHSTAVRDLSGQKCQACIRIKPPGFPSSHSLSDGPSNATRGAPPRARGLFVNELPGAATRGAPAPTRPLFLHEQMRRPAARAPAAFSGPARVRAAKM